MGHKPAEFLGNELRWKKGWKVVKDRKAGAGGVIHI